MINMAFRGHDVPGVRTFDELGAKLAAYGAHGVQLALPVQFQRLCEGTMLNPGMGQYCARALARHGVSVAVLGCYMNMIHPDPDIRERLLRRFECYLDNARFFGAPIVASETGSVREVPNVVDRRNFTDEVYAFTRDVIARLVAHAEGSDVIVGIEPGINHPIHSVERARQLLDDIQSPNLGIVFDPTALVYAGNYRRQREVVEQGFDLFADRIVAVHVCDYSVEPGHEQVIRCNNGEGILDTEFILDKINEYRPLVSVVFEETKGDAIAATVRRFSTYGDSTIVGTSCDCERITSPNKQYR